MPMLLLLTMRQHGTIRTRLLAIVSRIAVESITVGPRPRRVARCCRRAGRSVSRRGRRFLAVRRRPLGCSHFRRHPVVRVVLRSIHELSVTFIQRPPCDRDEIGQFVREVAHNVYSAFHPSGVGKWVPATFTFYSGYVMRVCGSAPTPLLRFQVPAELWLHPA